MNFGWLFVYENYNLLILYLRLYLFGRVLFYWDPLDACISTISRTSCTLFKARQNFFPHLVSTLYHEVWKCTIILWNIETCRNWTNVIQRLNQGESAAMQFNTHTHKHPHTHTRTHTHTHTHTHTRTTNCQ